MYNIYFTDKNKYEDIYEKRIKSENTVNVNIKMF